MTDDFIFNLFDDDTLTEKEEIVHLPAGVHPKAPEIADLNTIRSVSQKKPTTDEKTYPGVGHEKTYPNLKLEAQNLDPKIPVDEFLTPRETAKMLGVSVFTISQWRFKSNHELGEVELPFYLFGSRSIRYKKAEIQAYIESRRVDK